MRKILPHLTIVLAGMFLVFYVMDIFNEAMNFVGNRISKNLLVIFCISALLTAILAISQDRKRH